MSWLIHFRRLLFTYSSRSVHSPIHSFSIIKFYQISHFKRFASHCWLQEKSLNLKVSYNLILKVRHSGYLCNDWFLFFDFYLRTRPDMSIHLFIHVQFYSPDNDSRPFKVPLTPFYRFVHVVSFPSSAFYCTKMYPIVLISLFPLSDP